MLTLIFLYLYFQEKDRLREREEDREIAVQARKHTDTTIRETKTVRTISANQEAIWEQETIVNKRV